MAVQDVFWTIGNEAVAWGTKATTLTRGIEVKEDNVTPRLSHRVSRGFRAGTVGTPTGRSRAIDHGGTVITPVDLINKSLGLMLASVGSSVAITTPVGATNARLHTITPNTTGVTRSSTIHATRSDISGTARRSNYLGSMGTELRLSQAPNADAELSVTWDYKAEDTAASSVTPSYPSSPYIFGDTDLSVTIDGGSVLCQRNTDLTIPSGIDVDRLRACPGGREKPIVKDRVEPTANLSIDFPDLSYYNAFLAGTEVDDLVWEWTGPEIESGFDYFVRVTFARFQYTGASPKSYLDDLPEQSLPVKAIDDGTNPLWKIEYQTDDTVT